MSQTAPFSGGGGVIEHKMCVFIFSTTFIWNVPGLTPPPSSGCYWWLGNTKIKQPWFYQAISSTLKMEAQSVPETFENFHTFTWLCARKDFTAWVFLPICDTNMLSEIQSIHHNIQQNHKDKATNIQAEDFPLISCFYPFLIKLIKPVLNTPDIRRL